MMIVSGCGGSSTPRTDGDAGTDADTSEVADADNPADVHDAPGEDAHAIELDASVGCSSLTCGPGEVCVHEKGGVPDASQEDHCYLPSACDGVPTCDCVAGSHVSFRCGMTCWQLGDREFMCTGA
jgi:hypothetical protein